jgi:YD repeat-containing protein
MRAIRRSLNLVALLAVGACATASAGIGPLAEPLSGWEPIAVSFEPTPLRAPSYRAGPVRFAGGVVLRSEDPRFGGLSDLRLDASGGLVAVTDAGDLITARLILDTAGRLAGVGQVRLRRLTELDGLPISDRARGDAEGLAILPDGQVLVAFERDHRIWSYGRDAADRPSPRTHPGHAFANNEGMEGMVGDGAGGWYVAGEGGGFWHCDLTACEARAAPPEMPLSGYRPTGLALDAQTGGLLLLERFYEAPIDTRIRVRRIDRNGQVTAGLIALRLPATVDNFEGIATTLNADGSQRVYILSDDNFSARQRTLLLAFDLTPAR